MICRFWCPTHERSHFLAEAKDNLDNDACLEIGTITCAVFEYLPAIGILIRDSQGEVADANTG